MWFRKGVAPEGGASPARGAGQNVGNGSGQTPLGPDEQATRGIRREQASRKAGGTAPPAHRSIEAMRGGGAQAGRLSGGSSPGGARRQGRGACLWDAAAGRRAPAVPASPGGRTREGAHEDQGPVGG